MANKVIRNYAYDKRRQSFGGVDDKGNFISVNKKMYRGRIETVPTANFGPTSTTYQFFFMYNPVSMTHTSGVDPAYNPATMFESSGAYPADPSPFLSINQNVTWSILLDRTYETWHPKPGGSKQYLADWGVLADIKVLYAMFGMYTDFLADGSTESSKGVNPNTKKRMLTPTSTHLFRPAWAVFGPQLKYYGAITQFSVNYTHFTQAMVPNRAAVEFNMLLLPKGQTYAKVGDAKVLAQRANAKGGKTGARGGSGGKPWTAADIGP